MNAVEVSGLVIIATASGSQILRGVNLHVDRGEILAIVGESGSGKSTLGLAMLGYARPGTAITAGDVRVDEKDMLTLPPTELRSARGRRVAYVPQDPGMSLNPSLTIRRQLSDVVGGSPDAIRRIRAVLAEVGLPSDDAFLARRASELSGGQQQRVGIAMAIVPEPALVVLDEPTTGLDVTTQMMVLDLVSRLTQTHNMAAIYITHDLGVVGHVADRVVVLRDGRVVEEGDRRQVLSAPKVAYTRELISAVPSVHDHAARERGTIGAPVLEVRDLSASYGSNRVLDGVNLDVSAGECVAVVGESGSGKSTMSRCLIGLQPSQGEIVFSGQLLRDSAARRSREQRRRLQYVFQNPYASLHPRRTIGESIAVPLRFFGESSRRGIRDAVGEALERVELSRSFADRYPTELSGGQRQRAAVARALAPQPEILICDEITSALDVSVQASILRLLGSLQADGLGMLFITHNLAVVSALADRIAVLQRGRIVEIGDVGNVLTRPQSAYAKTLLSNTLDIADYAVKTP